MSKLRIILLLICTIPISVFGQSLRVTGVVTDAEDGSPLIGVSVIQEGTSNGVATDLDGQYTLTVPQNAVLVFSYIGMETQKHKATGNVLNVALSTSIILEEVVVVGYGTMRKSDLSGASVTIGEEKLKGSVIANFDQSLQGRVAGVTSSMTSGAPGSSVSINIRGQATVNSSSQPLYVIDGVPIQGTSSRGHDLGLGALGNGSGSSISPISSINPSDIVSMEILKDASATAIYGAQGANGVVLITTKRGKAGQAKFSYEGQFGVMDQVKRLDVMNLREYAMYNADLASKSGRTDGTPEYQDPSLLGAGTDWQDAIFRQAFMQQHNISAQGGTENVKYFVSGSFMDQEGTLLGTEFSRYSFRVNLDAQLKPWLKIGLNAMYSNTSEQLGLAEGSEGILTYALQTPPDIPVYDVYGDYAQTVREGYTRVNPIQRALEDQNKLYRDKLSGSIFLDITPIKDLVWHSELGYDISGSKATVWRPTYGDADSQVKRTQNNMSIQRNNSNYWQITNFLTYSKTIGKHYGSAMLGQEAWESTWENVRVYGAGLADNTIQNPSLGDPLLATIGSGFGSTAMASFFARLTYSYNDNYGLTYTFRRDGSSNFGPKNRWANFHSVAGNWRFSNEEFFESLKPVVSNGKLRLGWGQIGNANIGGYRWGAAISTMPSALGQGYRQSNIANPFIKWETQEQINIGLDLGFLHDRINLTVELYDKTSNDMLMELQLPSYMGTRGNGSSALAAPRGNYGEINNRGLEITINSRNTTGAFEWDTDFMIAFNRNKLVALDGTASSAIEGYGQWSDVISRSEIGNPLYQFYGYVYEGIYQSKEDIESHLWGQLPSNGVYDPYSTVFVGDVKFKDLNGDGVIDDRDRTNIGSPMPDFTFGMTNTFRYKNFDLSIFLQGNYGSKNMNYLGKDLTSMGYWTNQLTSAMDYSNLVPIDETISYPRTMTDSKGETYQINNWFEDINNVRIANPNTNMPRAGRDIYYDNNRTSSRYVEDASYLRIKNITFGYTVPTKWLRKYSLESVRAYVNVQNLYTFTDYSGYDPEVGLSPHSDNVFGLDYGRYPSPRTITFGLNVSF